MIQEKTLQAWADIVIEKWETKIRRLRVQDTGELVRSFQAHLSVNSGGNTEKIVFTYLYYGKFPDMGVGKGVPLELVGKKGTRRARPWMGKIFFSQLQQLGRIMAEKTGQQAVINIIEAIEAKGV